MKDLVLLGAGYGFWETIEIIRDINDSEDKYKVIAILDDNESLHGKTIDGIRVAGGLDLAKNYSDAEFVLCIGSKDTRKVRKDLVEKIGIERERYATLIHPTAKLYSSARLGYGCVLHHGSIIYSNSVFDDFVSLGANSIVGNDTHVHDFALIAGQSIVLNRVDVGEGAYVASAVSVFDEVKIGKYAVIGMGTVLMRNVDEDGFAFGNPGRIMKSLDNLNK